MCISVCKGKIGQQNMQSGKKHEWESVLVIVFVFFSILVVVYNYIV